ALKHREFAAALGLDPDAVAGDLFAYLDALVEDERAMHADLGWQAEVLSLGELLSSRLGSAYLSRNGVPLGWSDAREWLRAVEMPNRSEWAARLSVSCETSPAPDFRERYATQGE